MNLFQLFLTFLRVGATGFGGPMALIGMLQEHFLERRKALSSEEFAEGVAIGQILPGPIAVDAAIHIGYRIRGWLGAIAGATGICLPGFVLMLVLTPLYFKYGRVPQAQGFLAGMAPAVVAVIAAAGWRMGKRSLKSVGTAVIAVITFGAMLFGANAILLIVLAAALGVLLCPPAEEGDS